MPIKRVAVLTLFYGTFIMLTFLKIVGAFPYSWWWIVAIFCTVPAFVFFYAIYRAIVFRLFVKRNIK